MLFLMQENEKVDFIILILMYIKHGNINTVPVLSEYMISVLVLSLVDTMLLCVWHTYFVPAN